MKKSLFLSLFLLFFMLGPVFLAWNQNVPSRFAYQQVILLLSLGAFGLMLGQFWLSRLLPRNVAKMNFSSLLRWHKYIGYIAGVILLLHPVLMISRRFWVQESDPMENLLLLLRAPALLPAVIAWVLLALIVVLALVRRSLPAKIWRTLHGLLSASFAGLATWHVVAIGRHSNQAMSAFWIALAGGAIACLVFSYLPARLKALFRKEVEHETMQSTS